MAVWDPWTTGLGVLLGARKGIDAGMHSNSLVYSASCFAER